MSYNVKTKDSIVLAIIKKLDERSQRGLETYGKPLSEDHIGDLDYWLTHLEEELLDGVNYINTLRINLIQAGLIQKKDE